MNILRKFVYGPLEGPRNPWRSGTTASHPWCMTTHGKEAWFWPARVFGQGNSSVNVKLPWQLIHVFKYIEGQTKKKRVCIVWGPWTECRIRWVSLQWLWWSSTIFAWWNSPNKPLGECFSPGSSQLIPVQHYNLILWIRSSHTGLEEQNAVLILVVFRKNLMSWGSRLLISLLGFQMCLPYSPFTRTKANSG